MSIFNELLPKLTEISNAFSKNINDDLKAILECFDKFEEEFLNGRGRAREKASKDKNHLTTLQSINEDDDEPTKTPETVHTSRGSSGKSDETRSSSSSSGEKSKRLSNKRNKNEVDGITSPEQDKRHKRNASVKAQSIISKQVNVNLTQKMRREDTLDKSQSRTRRRKDEDKENAEPIPNIQIKQEKVSLPPEPMDMDSLPVNIEIKQEVNKDDFAMPPPTAPVPKPRKVAKDKLVQDESLDESGTGKRRATRTRKQTDNMPPPVAAARSTRASSRTGAPGRAAEPELPPAEPPQPEARPKRTRTRKKVSETAIDTEKDTTQTSQVDETASPADKRPKRTRRGQKAADKQEPQKIEPVISPKEEIITQSDTPQSPILPQKKNQNKDATKTKINAESDKESDTIKTKNKPKVNGVKSKIPQRTEVDSPNALNETHVLPTTETNDMDKTVVLPNGIYNHAPVTPKDVNINMNATVVLETFNRETIVLEKQTHIMDATVVIEKDAPAVNISEDNSILTDDNSDVQESQTPQKDVPNAQPTSAVKVKVQQFEELASRVTRTKTRAMAKKDDTAENQTPPDKIAKPILSAETLNKMNNLIFNGKAPQISSSATKPRANIVSSVKSFIPASTSKLSAINKAKEVEESMKKEKEDARKKKEALLEAKREQQKRKREEKMAAAAAAREAAEKERKAAMQAAARERQEKQAHADQGKLERLKDVERKKQELARKVAETEERRRAEEQARQQRLADEQRKADATRRKQIEEAEAMKKEAATMAKEIEKRQKEYIEKLKQKMETDKSHTPLRTPATPVQQYTAMEPVYMSDGFQYLNSDEEAEPVERPVPAWSTSKARRQQLSIQIQLSPSRVDRLFSVRVHSPDLRAIFPAIERARLKRTSSAVWHTPPQILATLHESPARRD